MKKVKKLDPAQKKLVMEALMQAKQGAGGPPPGAMPPGPPPQGAMPPPGAGAPPPGAPRPPGMKKGGFVPFAKKGAGKAGDKKEKWVPPWAKKEKKFAAGGSVVHSKGGRVGGKGDGCITRGGTKGMMR